MLATLMTQYMTQDNKDALVKRCMDVISNLKYSEAGNISLIDYINLKSHAWRLKARFGGSVESETVMVLQILADLRHVSYLKSAISTIDALSSYRNDYDKTTSYLISKIPIEVKKPRKTLTISSASVYMANQNAGGGGGGGNYDNGGGGGDHKWNGKPISLRDWKTKVLGMKTKDLHPQFSIWDSLSKQQKDILVAERQRRKSNKTTPGANFQNGKGKKFDKRLKNLQKSLKKANRRISEIQAKRNGNGDDDDNNDNSSGTASDPHARRGYRHN